MRRPRRILSVLGWALVGVAALVVGLYVLTLAVNSHDRPPSPPARQMAAILDELPDVADEDNAYVYMLGFGAPRDGDPWRIGAERAEWIRRLRTDYSLSRESDPYSAGLLEHWDAEEAPFFPDCPNPVEQAACFATLNEAGPALDEWLARQSWVLARYETLLGIGSWRGIYTRDTRGPYPTISNVPYARSAWLLEAWARARRGDAEGVREALGADLEFWRLVLAEAHSLTTKMLASSMVKRHFEESNIVLKRLPPARVGAAIPASWREPISVAERSLRRAFAFELRFMRNHLESLASPAYPYAAWANREPERPSLMDRLNSASASAFVQPQDSVNKRARTYSAVADALEGPYERMPAALERAWSLETQAPAPAAWSEPLYNFLGDTLRLAGGDAYARYPRRLADVEGVRRAALVTAELRSRGVAAGDVAAALADAELTDPYTGEPFDWDAEAGSVVFDGIAARRGGRHAFWY